MVDILRCKLDFLFDFSGTWSAAVQTNADSGTPTFLLKQDGDKLTGTYSDAYGDAAITGNDMDDN